VDLTNSDAVSRALDDADPDTVLHAAAVSTADAVLRDLHAARAVNIDATRQLAEWCVGSGRRFLFTSTDMVFDGSCAWNREEDPAVPVLEYGRTKRAAEDLVLAVPGSLVCRLSLLYGPSKCPRESFFDRAVADLKSGRPRAFFEDEFRTPLHYTVAAGFLVRLLESDAQGLIHVGGAERLSRFALMGRLASALSLDPSLVLANRQADVVLPEPRPADASLDTERLAGLLPDIARPLLP
jgi:dTDP-4-dehydrorhamnose reductase